MMVRANIVDFHEEGGYAEMTVKIKGAKLPYGNIFVYIDDGKEESCPICGSIFKGGK